MDILVDFAHRKQTIGGSCGHRAVEKKEASSHKRKCKKCSNCKSKRKVVRTRTVSLWKQAFAGTQDF